MPITYYPTFKNSSGNVGIATISPATKLDIYGPTSLRGTTVLTTNFDLNAGNAADIYANIRVLRGASLNDGMYIGYAGAGGPLRFFSNSGTTEFMTIATTGNVGIGNTNPSNKLDINGTALASSDFRAPIFYDSANTNFYCDPASTSKFNEIWTTDNGNNNTAPRWDTSFYVMQSQHWYSHTGTSTMYVGESGDFVYIRGYSTADGSFRSPIFYDSNNTSYYIDAASTSILNALVVAASGRVGGAASRSVSGLTVGFTDNSTFAANTDVGDSDRMLSIVNESTTTNAMSVLGFRVNPNGGTANAMMDIKFVQTGITNTSALHYTFNHGGTFADRFSILSSGNVGIGATAPAALLQLSTGTPTASTSGIQFGDDASARIFRSSSAVIRVTGAFEAGNGYIYASNYLQTGNNLIYPNGFSATQRLAIGNSANNAWIDGLTIAPGGTVTAYGDFRAPIFYDTDNTAYYINPASVSNIRHTIFDIGSNLVGATGVGVLFDGNYTTGQYRHRFRKYDDGSGLPLYIDYAHGTANSFTTIARFGGGGTYNSFSVYGTADASGDFRAPIFYDSNNTAYYVDPASTSVLNRLTIDGGNYANNYFQSLSDFVNGTLVTTDIPATAANGLSFVMNVVGKSYNTTTSPFNFSVQGYLYNSTIINYSGMSLDSTGLTTIKIFENGGFLCFWWARVTYWNAFEVSVRSYDTAKTNYNRVTNITDSTEPTGTKKVTVTLQKFMRADVSATNSVDLRAPIFYDSDNTAYYLNPAGNSQLTAVYANDWFRAQGNTGLYFQDKGYGITSAGAASNSYGNASTYGSGLNGWQGWGIGSRHCMMSTGGDNFGIHDNTRSWLYYWDGTYHNFQYGYLQSASSVRGPLFYDSDNTAYYCDPASTSNLNAITAAGNITAAQYYTGGWFRNSTSGYGLYNEVTGEHFYSDSANYWNVASSAGTQGIRFRTGGYNGTVRGYIIADTNNDVGLLNQDGNWRVRVVGGDYVLFDGSSVRAQIFYDSNDTNYYVNPASTSVLNSLTVTDGNLELYKSQTVDMSNTTTFNTSTYYPVTISVPTEGCIIQIQNNLNSNVPSWSTHPSGFTLNLRWRTNGSGWGTTAVRRYIEQYFEQFTNQTICGGITQMTNSSTEVVWLRGGGQYLFRFSRNLSATAQSTTYTVNSQSVTPTSTAQNTIWNAYSGAWTLYNDATISTSNMYTPILYDWNNSAYYVDPSSTSNLVGLTVANTITGSISGNAGTANTLATARTINGTSFNGSANITTSTWGTSRNITIGATIKAVDGSASVSWTLAEITGSQAANVFLASPNGTTGNPTFRSIVAADIPTLNQNTTGSSASCTGNSATATNLSTNRTNWSTNGTISAVVGQLAWKHYGNNHTIIDASNSTAPDGTAINNTNPGTAWSGTYPTLMGWNGSSTYGVRVDSSRYADQVGYSPNRTDSTTYPILWGAGSTYTVAYSCASTYIQSSTGTIYANAFYDAGNTTYYLDPASSSFLYTVRANNFYANQVSVTASASTTINTLYNVTELTLSASITTLTFSSIQSSTITTMWTVVTVGNGTTYSITWPAAVKWPGGTAPTITSTNGKKDIYQFITYDGGTNIYAIIVGQNL